MTNLLTGDSSTFTNGLGVWVEYSSTSRFDLTHNSIDGAAQVAVTNGGVNMTIATSRDADPLTAKFPVTEGATLTLACRARYTAGAARNFLMRVEYYNASNAIVGTIAVPSAYPAALTPSWTNYSGTTVVPTGTGIARAQLTIRFEGTVTGDVYQVDDVVLDEGGAAPNTPPTANAGADQSVAPGATVTLTGTDSDADGTVASRSWAQTSGTAVTLSGTGATRTFTAPAAPNTLVFAYTVTDDDGATATDSVTVSVVATTPPPTGTNLLTGNTANFATGIGTWIKMTGAGNFTAAHSTADGGVLALDVTTGGSNIAVSSHAPGDTDKPSFTPGQTVTFAITIKQVDGVARNCRVEGTWHGADKTTPAAGGSNYLATSGTLTVGSAVTLTGSLVAPADAYSARMRVWFNAPAAGETFHLDNASISVATSGGGGGDDFGNAKSYDRVGDQWILTLEYDVSPPPVGPARIRIDRLNVGTLPGATISNLRAVAGSGQVALSWTEPNPSDAVTDYAIDYGSTSTGPWTRFVDAVSTSTTATVTGLTDGATYWFRVAPIRTNVIGTFSPPISATPAALSGPSALRATAGNSSVTLAWTAPSPATGVTDYSVRYRRATVNEWTVHAHTASTLTQRTVGSLVNGTEYVFEVAAVRSGVVGVYTAGPVSSTPVAPAATGSIFDEHVGFGNPGLTNPTTITVTTLADSGAGSLRAAVAGNAHKHVMFAQALTNGTIQLSSGPIRPGSNTLVDGRGRNITVKGTNTSGGFALESVFNVTLTDFSVTDCGNLALSGADDPHDCIELSSVDHVWLHHLNLARASDKAVGMNLSNRNVTVSWCHFYDQDQTFQSGNDFDGESQGSLVRLTLHHNYWDRTGYRHPVVSYGKAHVYNNYYRDFALFGARSQRIAELHFENNVLYLVRNARATMITGTGGASKDSRDGFLTVAGNVALPGSLAPTFQTAAHGFVPSNFYAYTAEAANQGLADRIVAGAGPR